MQHLSSFIRDWVTSVAPIHHLSRSSGDGVVGKELVEREPAMIHEDRSHLQLFYPCRPPHTPREIYKVLRLIQPLEADERHIAISAETRYLVLADLWRRVGHHAIFWITFAIPPPQASFGRAESSPHTLLRDHRVWCCPDRDPRRS